jgi:hypothetical protein
MRFATPVLKHGTAQAPTASGLRTALLPEVAKRKDAAVREARR